ncbi:hypothetical protein FV230_08480 [Methylobacterium sp. WL6]|nr:hypothetical protein FV230_08480 [Methylobacterium sp. WL6]
MQLGRHTWRVCGIVGNGHSHQEVARCILGRNEMLTGSLLWLIGVPIPVILLAWFFFFRGR